MQYCPSCKLSYPDEVVVCPDCRMELVPQVAERRQAVAQPIDDSWRPVCAVRGTTQTDLAVEALDLDNIPSTVMSQAYSAFARLMSTPTGMTENTDDANIILVPKEFLEEAQMALDMLENDHIQLYRPY